MFRFKCHPLILAAVVVSAFAASVTAESLECEILQYKLGRLYFGAGQEQDIYPGCTFVLTRGNDTVCTGQVEHSYLGVSLSRPTFGLNDTLDLKNYKALIEPAAIDSTSSILIGCYGLVSGQIVRWDDQGESVFADEGPASYWGLKGNPIVFGTGEEYLLPWDYETKQWDGIITYSVPPDNIRREAEISSSPAPYIAVLIPNLTNKANEHGILSTSLYYRFDVARLWPTFYEREVPTALNRLYLVSGEGPRSYPYDPEKGQQLLANDRDRPSAIKLAALLPHFQPAADFFADVLSRDRIKVDVRQYNEDYDLLITIIPVDWNDPTLSLREIHRRLQWSNLKSKRIKEALQILGDQIEAAEKATDVSTKFHYCRLADRTLQNDLGVFPLFRPNVYFIRNANLKNGSFDESGYLDVSSLVKITIPAPEWEEQK